MKYTSLMVLLVCTALLLITSCASQQNLSAFEASIQGYSILGDPDAPVTIFEFSDYQCPFCKKFTTETLPLIKENYIDTGKARLVFKDFPLAIHGEARVAAIATNCAGEQGAYYDYHDILFENSRDFSRENFEKWAADLGLDAQLFQTCLDDEKQELIVERNFKEGRFMGVRGTPTFFVNGKMILGPQPYEVFSGAIDAALGESRVELEASDDALCTSDADCDPPRTFGPYCSSSDAQQVCTTSSTPTCSLPGTSASACVVIIKEECSLCTDAETCSDGVCGGEEKTSSEEKISSATHATEPSLTTFGFEGSAIGKSHEGTFDEIELFLDLDGGKVGRADFIIQAASVNTGIAGLDKHLKSDDFFDVEKYPAIEFSLSALDDDLATGMLNFHGVEKEVSFPLTIASDKASADFLFDTTDFNMKYIGVNKEVRIFFEISLP